MLHVNYEDSCNIEELERLVFLNYLHSVSQNVYLMSKSMCDVKGNDVIVNLNDVVNAIGKMKLSKSLNVHGLCL